MDIETLRTLQSATTPEQRIFAGKAAKQENIEALQKALSHYEAVLEMDPNDGEAYCDIVNAKRCLSSLRDSAEMESLETFLQKGLELNPDSVRLWLALGVHSKDPEKREYALCRSLELSPENSDGWLALAKLYHEHGHLSLAQEAITKARIHDPSSESVWIRMGEMESDPNKAIDLLGHALYQGNSLEACVSLMSFFDRNGSRWLEGTYQNIIQNAVRRCIYALPLDPAVWNAHGLCLESEEDWPSAILSFETALACFEEKSDSKSIEMHQRADKIRSNLGRVLLKTGKIKQSISCFEQLQYRDSTTELNFALALFKVGLSTSPN